MCFFMHSGNTGAEGLHPWNFMCVFVQLKFLENDFMTITFL